MSNVYGVIANASYYGTLANKQTNGVVDARVKAMLDYYNTTGSEGTNQSVLMHPTLPVGAKIVGQRLTFSANLTPGVLVHVGDLVCATRYIISAPVTAAVAYDMFTTTYGVPNSSQYVIGTTDTNASSTDKQIVVTLGNATNNTQAGTIIKLTTLYTMD